MRVVLLVLLSIVLLVSAAVGLLLQPFVVPVPLRPPAVDPARLEAHVKRLSVDFHPRSHEQTDNLFDGRLAPSPNAESA
jgi:hypothetical protein